MFLQVSLYLHIKITTALKEFFHRDPQRYLNFYYSVKIALGNSVV